MAPLNPVGLWAGSTIWMWVLVVPLGQFFPLGLILLHLCAMKAWD